MRAVPLVSVVMLVTDVEGFDESLGSILLQTEQRFEVIVADLTNTKEIEGIVSKWEDPRVKYILSNSNSHNLSNQLQLIIEKAEGVYLQVIENNDFLIQYTLEKLIKIISEYPASAICHSSLEINAHGALINKINSFPKDQILELKTNDLIVNVLANKPLIRNMSGCFFYTKTIKQVPNAFQINGIETVYYKQFVLLLHLIMKQEKIIYYSLEGTATRVEDRKKPPIRSAKFFEKEFFIRWNANNQLLNSEEFKIAEKIWIKEYEENLNVFPELKQLLLIHRIPIKNNIYCPDFYINTLINTYKKERSNGFN